MALITDKKGKKQQARMERKRVETVFQSVRETIRQCARDEK